MQQDVDLHGTTKRRIHKLTGHTRDRTGCLTCRQRKKKCDRSLDSCGPCRRLNLRCVWEPEREIMPTLTPATLSSTTAGHVEHRPTGVNSALIKAPHPLQFWLEVTGNIPSITFNRRSALRYYVQTFAVILSTNAENNGFLSGMPI